jgi:DNA-binding transcriptional LysR family regulator
MEISQLRCFLAVMDEGAIGKAAHRLDIAQPALSQSISRMEKSLGTVLFERSRRGARPTAAALVMAQDIRNGLYLLDEAAGKARQAQLGLAGTLRIGLVSSALFEVLPKAIRAIRRHAPNLQLVLKEMSNEEQVLALEDGTLDVGLMHSPVAVSGPMSERVLRKDKLIAAVPSDLALRLKKKISLRQIAEQGMVLYPKGQLPHLYAGITQAMRQAGHEVKINQHANRTMTVLACVAGGCGIGLLPSWIQTIDFPGVTFCPISEGDALPSFDLVAIWSTRNKFDLAKLFADI